MFEGSHRNNGGSHKKITAKQKKEQKVQALVKARVVLAEKRAAGLIAPKIPNGELIPAVTFTVQPHQGAEAPQGEMTLKQAIGMLEGQHLFLGDVINLLRGLQKQGV